MRRAARANRVANAVVDHGGGLTVRLEQVGVLPERVGALYSSVDEAHRRFPGLDPDLPAHRHSVQLKLVVEQSRGRIATSAGVITSKRSQGGVIGSKLRAST